jgi:hypothetical protein
MGDNSPQDDHSAYNESSFSYGNLISNFPYQKQPCLLYYYINTYIRLEKEEEKSPP